MFIINITNYYFHNCLLKNCSCLKKYYVLCAPVDIIWMAIMKLNLLFIIIVFKSVKVDRWSGINNNTNHQTKKLQFVSF